ncbi:Alpha/Beta hydrolase protein [Mrakia frigida]|uniref:alpha/beta hydrolase n=1 Tax=Mrakia frigida TaxID=29902 RepID=UPI003FCBF5CD
MSYLPLNPLTFTYRTIPSPSSTSSIPPIHLSLDVHLPPSSVSNPINSPTSIPLIFAVHPGGLTAYINKHLPPWLFELARHKGWCVVAPNYRLLVGGGDGGEQGLDAGDVLEDVLRAYEWVVGGSLEKKLKRRGEVDARLDLERVAVVGMSAGGLLSLLLPTQLPSSLPIPTSLIALYPVARSFSPFYTTHRTSSPLDPTPLSLNIPPSFLTVANSLFARLTSEPTTSFSPSLSPAEMRVLEQPGPDGHRGMLYDWSIDRGVFGDLCLGKGVFGSKARTTRRLPRLSTRFKEGFPLSSARTHSPVAATRKRF